MNSISKKIILGTLIFLIISTLLESLRKGHGISSFSLEQGVYRVLFALVLALLFGLIGFFMKKKSYNWDVFWYTYLGCWLLMTLVTFIAMLN